jgi:hypothetical protein
MSAANPNPMEKSMVSVLVVANVGGGSLLLYGVFFYVLDLIIGVFFLFIYLFINRMQP